MANALDSYLEEIEPWAGYDLGIDLEAIAASDNKAAINYATASLKAAWSALPASLRAEAIDRIEDLGAELISAAVGITGSAPLNKLAQTIDGSIQESTESVGPVVKFLIAVVLGVVKIVQAVRDGRIDQANTDLYWARANFVRNDRRVEDYVFRDRECPGYPAYTGPGSPLNRWAAAITPDRGESEFFYGIKVPPVKGKWRKSNGVALNCDIGHTDYTDRWGGCDVTGNYKDRFEGYVLSTVLSFPYWSPSYPSRPMPPHEVKGPDGETVVTYDPNGPMMRAQVLAFVSPDDNFQIWETTVIWAVQNMRARWISEIESGKYVGTIADPDEKRARDFSRKWTPDLVRDPAHYAAETSKRFYFDDDGTIKIYPGFEGDFLDLAAFGINPHPLANGDQGLAQSIADFNAVVSSARSMFTARASFLRSHTTCKGILADAKFYGWNIDERYGEKLAAAIRAGATARSGAAGGIKSNGGSVAAGGGWATEKPRPKPRLPDPPPIGSGSPSLSDATPRSRAWIIVAAVVLVGAIGSGIAAAFGRKDRR